MHGANKITSKYFIRDSLGDFSRNVENDFKNNNCPKPSEMVEMCCDIIIIYIHLINNKVQ